MDSYEQSYQQQLEDVNEIIAVGIYKDNDELYDKCRVDYREMKRDLKQIVINLVRQQVSLETEIEKIRAKVRAI